MSGDATYSSCPQMFQLEDDEPVGSEGSPVAAAPDSPQHYSCLTSEVCMDVVNCLLNLLASCLGEEIGVSLKFIASLSAEGFALP